MKVNFTTNVILYLNVQRGYITYDINTEFRNEYLVIEDLIKSKLKQMGKILY